MPETKEAAVPTTPTPPRAFLATACPPSSGKRGPSRSRSSASPGSSGGRLSPPIDADGFQLVVGRMGKGRSGAKVPKKAREMEREGWEFVISTITTTASSRWRATTTTTTASSRRATTTTTTTRADISFFRLVLLKGQAREKNLLIPAAAGSFSLDAALGLLATRRRLGRRGDSFALPALSFCGVSCMYEEFHKKKK